MIKQDDIKHPLSQPIGIYVLIWLILIVLTVLTVTVAGMELGSISIMGAIVIATVKSILVVMFFMKIKYEDKVFKLMLGITVFTLVVILLMTFADISFR